MQLPLFSCAARAGPHEKRRPQPRRHALLHGLWMPPTRRCCCRQMEAAHQEVHGCAGERLERIASRQSNRLLVHETRSELPVPPPSFGDGAVARQRQDVSTTTKVGVGTALAYALSYFWRYPIFILPGEQLQKHVGTVAGRPLDLQACFSMAFILGFGAAKAPMASFVSSDTFFRRRFAAIASMLVSSMLIEGVGVWAFAAHPAAQVACVFVSSFISSGLYGACYGAYLEGRRSTETLLALVTGSLIYAGNLARGTAAWVLSLGAGWHTSPTPGGTGMSLRRAWRGARLA